MKANELLLQQCEPARQVREQLVEARTALQKTRVGVMGIRERLDMANRRVLPMNYNDPGVTERLGHVWNTIEGAAQAFSAAEDILSGMMQQLILLEQLCTIPSEGDTSGRS